MNEQQDIKKKGRREQLKSVTKKINNLEGREKKRKKEEKTNSRSSSTKRRKVAEKGEEPKR